MDSDARFIYVNEAACAALGYAREELLSMTVHDIDPDFSAEVWPAHWNEVRQRGSFIIESRHRAKDGRIYPVEISINYMEFEGKEFSCAFARDITGRKRAREELRRQNEYLSALHDTTLGLISRLDLDELLAALVTRAGQLLGAQNGFIYLAEPGAKKLELKVGIGPFGRKSPNYMEPGEGLAGRVWQTGKSLVIEDYDAWTGRLPSFEYNLLGSAVGVPLTRTRRTSESGHQAAGMIGLAYDATSDLMFGDAEVELLGRFAQLASIALENARLYQETQRRAHSTRPRFADAWCRVCTIPWVTMFWRSTCWMRPPATGCMPPASVMMSPTTASPAIRDWVGVHFWTANSNTYRTFPKTLAISLARGAPKWTCRCPSVKTCAVC
jgi:PAS domain S-box-containing protein